MKSENNINLKKNILFHNLNFIFRNLMQITIGVYFANYLGPEGYGLFQSKVVFVSYFTLISQFINPDILLNEYKKNGYNNLVSDLVLCSFMSFLAFFIANIFSIFLYQDSLINTLIFVLSLNLLVNVLVPITIGGLLSGYESLNILAMFLTKLGMYAWRLFGILTNQEILFFAFSVLIEIVIFSLVTLYVFKLSKLKNKTLNKFNLKHSINLIKATSKIFIANILNLSYIAFSVFIVEISFSSFFLGKFSLLFGLQAGLSGIMIAFSRYLHINFLKITDNKNYNYKNIILLINFIFTGLLVLSSSLIFKLISDRYLLKFDISLVEILLIFSISFVINNRFAYQQIKILQKKENELWKLDVFVNVFIIPFYFYSFFSSVNFNMFLMSYVAIIFISNFSFILFSKTHNNESVNDLKIKEILSKAFE